MTDPLREDDLTATLGDRPFRFFPAILSAAAEAQAWARQGAPPGAVVVPGYEAAPRGRAGWPWEIQPEDVTFSQVVFPRLSPEREGWLYAVAAAALADVIDAAAEFHWPDLLTRRGGEPTAHIGIHAELGPALVDWAVVTVLVRAPSTTRASAVATTAEAIDRSLSRDPDPVLDELRSRCATLGARVRALMIPMGPSGPRVEGTAADLKHDGALVIATPAGGRIAVRPQHLGRLELMEG